MSDLTRLINRIASGQPLDSDELTHEIYGELHQIASRLLHKEYLQNSLQATELVNEAFLKLFPNADSALPNSSSDSESEESGPGFQAHSDSQPSPWTNRSHFFAAASESMRRILVDAARHRLAKKRGGDCQRVFPELDRLVGPTPDDKLLALDEVLDHLQSADPQAAQLVKLRFFMGLSMAEISEAMGVSVRTAGNLWRYARAWLKNALDVPESEL